MSLVLTNTLSGRKEPLVLREPGHARLYWCGVTVYSRSHVGHARALITADVLCRWLRARGTRVTFVRNFTDIDDKIIRRAAEEGITPQALTEREIASFQEDVRWLGCLPPDHEPRATAHVPDMLAMIARLVAKGLAYPVAGGSVYFRVRRFAGYGKLSHQRLEDMASGEEIDAGKEDAHDFALWKGAKPGEPQWESPWGPGRPGWHIECSAMAAAYLGASIDVHGGGADLIFPHHENEIAQSEGDSGACFAQLWVHNGMITSGAEKMSKSLGNILPIAEVAKRVPADAMRLLFLGTHYRAPLDFASGRLDDGLHQLERLAETLARADEVKGQVTPAAPLDGSLAAPASAFEREFAAAMDDDLNAAKALGLVFDRIRDLNRALDAGNRGDAAAARAELARVLPSLGVLGGDPTGVLADLRARGRQKSGLSEAEIEAMIAARNAARGRKDFREADAIRGQLREQGIVLEDGPTGTTWKAG
ncbi:MAG: cysteine--tRNA ligase [bacterium]|nr:cysteine--tRNA ligase [bacterium]